MKDSCRRFRSLLLEGCLLPRAQWTPDVADHLAGCPSCAALARELKAIAEALHSLPEEPLPAALTPHAVRQREAQGEIRWLEAPYAPLRPAPPAGPTGWWGLFLLSRARPRPPRATSLGAPL